MSRFWRAVVTGPAVGPIGRGLSRTSSRSAGAILLVGVFLSTALTQPAGAQCTGCTNASFGPAGSFQPIIEQGSMLVADFNHDGVSDIAIAGQTALSIYLGNGSGGFVLSSTSPLPGWANSIAQGDFNRDGNIDIAVAFYNGLGTGQLLLFFGNGAGGVSSPTPIPLGGQPVSVIAADFNGDGKVDLAVGITFGTGDTSQPSVSVLLGDGTGGFAPALVTPAQGNPMSIAAGDINGDGIPDLAVSYFQELQFLLGTGDGHFVPASQVQLSVPQGVVFADFNEDGKLDVALLSAGGSWQINVLFGHGDGQFSPPTAFFFNSAALPVAGDFNHDGHLDLLTAGAVFLGDGTGNFVETPTSLPYPPLVTGDFDGDGLLDIAASQGFPGLPGFLIVLFGLPDGTFTSPPQFPAPEFLSNALVLDLNHDGKPDVLTLATEGNLIAFLGDGNGGFSPPITTPSSAPVGDFVTGDFDEDGLPDVVMRSVDMNGQRIFLFFHGDGTGHFAMPVSFPSPPGFGLVAGDFTGDHHLDLLVGNSSPSTSKILPGDGHGHFGPPINSISLPETGTLLATDLNGDGRMDLVLNGSSFKLYTFIGGPSGFEPASQIPNTAYFLFADVNKDGKQDLITTTVGASPYLSVRLGKSNGLYGSEKKIPLKLGGRPAVAADFNGDGKVDLAIDDFGGVTILLGDNTGNFHESSSFAFPFAAGVLGVGDFTGDSKPDLVGWGSTSTSGFICLLPNTNCEPRRLVLASPLTSCETAGAPLIPAVTVDVTDDGGNLVACDNGTVMASIVPGSGTPGATLGGSAASAISGIATFSNLSINLPGRGYRLSFQHSQTKFRVTNPFSLSLPAPSIAGPAQTCTAGTFIFDGGAGYDSYAWTLDGAPAGNSRLVTLKTLAIGSHQLRLTVTQENCQATGGLSLNTVASPAPPVASNNGPVPFGTALHLFATTVPGATGYSWTGPDGFSSDLQNPTIPGATPASSGNYSVSVQTSVGCGSAATTKAVVLPAPLCAGCANPSFGPAERLIPVADNLVAIVAGDFDRDGATDIAIAHGGFTNKISLLRGNGHGGFFPEIVSPTFPSPVRSLFAADLNGDGLLDVVSLSFTGVTVGLGSPSGLFQSPVSYDTGSTPSDLAIADVNHDGVPDLLVANRDSNTVSLLLGMGSGAFAAAVNISTTVSSPTAILVQDVDHDGNLDVIVANGQSASLSILLGDGHGGFHLGSTVSLTGNPISLATGDLTGDGVADLVVGVSNSPNQSLAIFQGSPAGTFSLLRSIPLTWSGPVTVADINGDGQLDIAVIGSDGVWVLFGRGGGVLDPPVDYFAGPAEIDSPSTVPVSLAVADVTGDGTPDLIVGRGAGATFASFQTASQIAVLEGDGHGGFAEPSGFDVGFMADRVIVSDLNHDGYPDLLIGADNGISVFLADGKGSYLPPQRFTIPVGFVSGGFTLGDVNGDGAPDLVTFDPYQGRVLIFPGDGHGNFGIPVLTTIPLQMTFLAGGDFNGDGRLDLLMTDSSYTISILQGRADFTFGAPVAVTGLIQANYVAVADIDGDKKLDFIVANASKAISVYRGDGNGGFAAPITTPLDSSPGPIAVGDFDDDGKLDIVVYAGGDNNFFRATKGLRFLAGDGAGGFGPPQSFAWIDSSIPFPRGPGDVVAADFNGDGKLDIAAALPSIGAVEILMGDGHGGFAAPVTYLAGHFPPYLAVADLNGDGRPDLVIPDVFPAAVRFLFNTSCVPKHLGVAAGPACTTTGQVFASQPVVDVLDDGENVIACDSLLISASILNGTGTSGAVLGGTTSLNAVSGVGAFTNLSIDRAGTGYVLEFQHPLASRARTPAFTVGSSPSSPAAASNGPVCLGQTLQLSASAVPGGIFRWTGPNGFSATVQNPTIPAVTMAAAGLYSVFVDVNGCDSVVATTNVVIRPLPSASITAPASACPGTAGLVASVPDAGPGATYAWSISNGLITSGAGTPSITFSTGYIGLTTLSVIVTDSNGCSSTGNAFTSVAATCAMNFYTLTPCRILDTRNQDGPYGGPPLSAFGTRNFPLTNRCGIPSTALAISANVTVTQSNVPGGLRIYAGGIGIRLSEVTDYGSGQTRANNAILALGASGDIDVYCDQVFGTVQFILDVNGYFQ